MVVVGSILLRQFCQRQIQRLSRPLGRIGAMRSESSSGSSMFDNERNKELADTIDAARVIKVELFG